MVTTCRSHRGPNLPSQILEFLVQFAHALQKHAIYPPRHPALEPAARAVTQRLDALLVGERLTLSIVVARDRLSVEGAATDPRHTLLSSLVRHLHRHQLLSLSFNRGVRVDEVVDLFGSISAEVGPTEEPLGASLEGRQPISDHIQLQSMPYESLAFLTGKKNEEPKRESLDIWDAELDATLYAPWVEEAAGQLQKILAADLETAEKLQKGIAWLMANVGPDNLQLLRKKLRGTDLDRALPFGMSPEVVAESIAAFAENAETELQQEVNDLLLGVFMKLAIHAQSVDGSRGPPTDEAVPGLVRRMTGGWQVISPNPDDHKLILDHFLANTPILEAGKKWTGSPDPERILRMSLEIDEISPTAEQAVATMVEEGRLASLLNILDGAPQPSTAAEDLWRAVACLATVRHILRDEPPDFETLDRLTPRIGPSAAEPMLDVLTESVSMSTRRSLFNRLSLMGSEIGEAVVVRLEDQRWFVRRNMLALLKELPTLPEGFSPAPYLEDPEPKLRRAAFELAVRMPDDQEQAILCALQDTDEPNIALGLRAVESSCPAAALPYVISHVLDPQIAPQLRISGIRALSASGSSDALRALLRLTRRRKWLFWRQLAPRSPVMVAALAGLAATWSKDREVQVVLKFAEHEDDSEIRATLAAAEAAE